MGDYRTCLKVAGLGVLFVPFEMFGLVRDVPGFINIGLAFQGVAITCAAFMSVMEFISDRSRRIERFWRGK